MFCQLSIHFLKMYFLPSTLDLIYQIFVFPFFFAVLGIECRALCMLGKHPTIELCSQPPNTHCLNQFERGFLKILIFLKYNLHVIKNYSFLLYVLNFVSCIYPFNCHNIQDVEKFPTPLKVFLYNFMIDSLTDPQQELICCQYHFACYKMII